MTGLDPDNDLIIEIATVVTDKYLNVLAAGPVIAVHQSDQALAAMDAWNQEHHGKSGLIERVNASTIDDSDAMQQTLDL
jgi:oligoribonuclease